MKLRRITPDDIRRMIAAKTGRDPGPLDPDRIRPLSKKEMERPLLELLPAERAAFKAAKGVRREVATVEMPKPGRHESAFVARKRRTPSRKKRPAPVAPEIKRLRDAVASRLKTALQIGLLFRKEEETFQSIGWWLADELKRGTPPGFVEKMCAFRRRFAQLGDGGWKESAHAAKARLPGAGRPKNVFERSEMEIGHGGPGPRKEGPFRAISRVGTVALHFRDVHHERAKRLTHHAMALFGIPKAALNARDAIDDRPHRRQIAAIVGPKPRGRKRKESLVRSENMLEAVGSWLASHEKTAKAGFRITDVLDGLDAESTKAAEQAIARALISLGAKKAFVGKGGARVRGWKLPG